ncbi:MAG TPA: hypothetical protein VNT79_03235, partial [Phycisphaerae bacterium]|nr:hypothetical protein [Phycisphaerae bacterium]
MVRRPPDEVGGLIGIVIGGVFALALLASPFYLSLFQDDAARLDTALAEPIENMRLAVLNLDESLVALSDARLLADQQ